MVQNGAKFNRSLKRWELPPGSNPTARMGVQGEEGKPSQPPLGQKAAALLKDEERKAKAKTKDEDSLPSLKSSRGRIDDMKRAIDYPRGQVKKDGKEYVTDIDGTIQRFKKQKDAIDFVANYAEKERRISYERLSNRYQQELKKGIEFDNIQTKNKQRIAKVKLSDGTTEEWIAADGNRDYLWQDRSRVAGLKTPSLEVTHLGEKFFIYAPFPD